MRNFIQAFLLESNQTSVRWQAHSLILNIFRNSLANQQEALLDLLWKLWPLLSSYGRKAAQFVDVLGYFTLKTLSSQTSKKSKVTLLNPVRNGWIVCQEKKIMFCFSRNMSKKPLNCLGFRTASWPITQMPTFTTRCWVWLSLMDSTWRAIPVSSVITQRLHSPTSSYQRSKSTPVLPQRPR